DELERSKDEIKRAAGEARIAVPRVKMELERANREMERANGEVAREGKPQMQWIGTGRPGTRTLALPLDDTPREGLDEIGKDLRTMSRILNKVVDKMRHSEHSNTAF